MSDHRDRIAVQDLVIAFGLAADRRDWNRLAGLMTDPVHADWTSLTGGEPEELAPRALVARWVPVFEALRLTQHFIGPPLIELDGDAAASAEANFIATHVLPRPDHPHRSWTLGGHYRFLARRLEEGWRLASIVMTAGWQAGDESVMTEAARAAGVRGAT